MTDPNPRSQPTSEELAAKAAAEFGLGAGDKARLANSRASRPQVDSMRETVESIAVAFILAFLFRSFVAEAFVIPTGSMATTLMGRHKDVQCPNCKYQYQASASA